MSDNETCDCHEHGVQPITFVCNHITVAPRGDTVGFVSFESDDHDDLRDAWCNACDAYLQVNGGKWVEGAVEVPGGSRILCAECYRMREAHARRTGRRVIYATN